MYWFPKLDKKNVIIKPKNTDDKCFQYAVTVALIYEKINWNLKRVLNIKSFIKKYFCDKNNPKIPLNVSYVKEKEIRSTSILKIYSNW